MKDRRSRAGSAIRLAALVAALSAITPEFARACESCFGAGTDSPVVNAIGISMLSLLIITGVVLGGITKFFTDMSRRAQSLEDAGYRDDVSRN